MDGAWEKGRQWWSKFGGRAIAGLIILGVIVWGVGTRKPSIATAVHVAVRSSAVMGSSSGVLQISNWTSKPMLVQVLVHNKENQQSSSWQMNVTPWQTWDIGWTYGWSFVPHEEIYIASDGYEGAVWETTLMETGGVGIQLQKQ